MNRKKRFFALVCFITIFLFVSISLVSANEDQIYVVPIDGEVGPAMEVFVEESIEEAEANNAEAIIFNINTPGGRVDSAVNISEAILNTPLKTIAYVNDEAISAGTIITISAEDIFMSPTATIGAAETRPNEEKYISYWTGKLRSVAEMRGRNPELVAAMADADVEIEGVSERGKILTLTADGAMNLEFADGIEQSLEGIRDAVGLDDYQLNELTPSFQLLLASLVTSTVGASVLLTIGFVGMVVEIFTPGFGVGGVTGLVAFGLYFGGGLLAGASSFVVVIIFLISIILLLIEVFAPGFGVPGVLGVVGMIVSIIMASSSAEQAVISLLVAFALTIVAIILLIKYAPRNKVFEKISLGTSLDRDSGYRSTTDYKEYEGKIGKVISPLRPAGTIEIEDKRLDAVSESSYIETGQEVRVVKIEGSRIVVRKTN